MKVIHSKARQRQSRLPCGFALIACACWLIALSSSAQPTFVELHGRLRISGNQVVDQKGEPTVLHGMSLYAWSQQGKQFFNSSAIDHLARDWKCTVIRAVVLPWDYRRNPEAELGRVRTVVDACIANGIYVVINWHSMAGAQNGIPLAQAFYTNLAMAYGHTPNVMYEPWNEPVQESWPVIKAYHEAIISSIRPIDPLSIIICGCRHWDQECEEASRNPITISSNIAYSIHFYAATHRQSLRDNAARALQNGIALFCTEYGTCAASGNGALDTAETQVWWNWLDEHKRISSANWSVAALDETSAAFRPGASVTGPWTDAMLKPSGLLVRDYFRSRYTAASTSIPGQSQSSAPEPVRLSSFDPKVKQLVAQMTLAEKIGQMTQPEHTAALEKSMDVQGLFIGSVLSGGGSKPSGSNTPQNWANIYDRYQGQALKTRLKIPLLYGIDALHGHNDVVGAVLFPHNIGLGCTRDPELVEKVSRITSEEVRATGINWTFAPCVTVPQDERWGRTYEGYSEQPEVVQLLGAAAVRGLQGSSLSDPLSIAACAKHFIGDGGTTLGTGQRGVLDQGDTRVDEATLRRIHLPGYLTTIQAGVATIMPSYNSWNGVKCSGNKHLLTDILKGELGFQGFLISDYNAIAQITNNYKAAIGISINAGMDMAMEPTDYRSFIDNLTALVNEGTVPMSRIDDAVTRILRVKFALGLMDTNRSVLADRSLQKSFGSAEHRAVARQAVRESLVLLKNDRHTLPISKQAARIAIAGKSADDLGNQCGGWTVEWQGHSGAVTTGGTTILAAISKAAGPNSKVTYSQDGANAAGADVGVVVIGETPYAEMEGDRRDLRLDAADQQAVANMKKAGIPVVVVLLSGRPLILGDIVNQADAIVAAWLPGTEGEGVADVLFGDYKPTGKLSFAWPRSMDQIPSHPDNANYDPLFKFGYGLTY